MTLTPQTANAAIKRLLLSCITPAMAAETEDITRIGERINVCIDRVKAEASEGAALVGDAGSGAEGFGRP